MLLLTKTEVDSLMPGYDALVPMLEETFKRRHSRSVVMPPKHWLATGSGEGSRFYSAMTALDLSGEWGAICKWQSGSSGNAAIGLPYLLGLAILSDAETGVPLAVMDSTSVTAIRAAAATAVTAKHLAPSEAATLAMIGCGVQGRTNATALTHVLPRLATVRGYDVAPETLERYAAFVTGELELEFVKCDTAEQALDGADVIVTAAPIEVRDEPLIRPEWIRKPALLVTLDYDCAIDSAMLSAAVKVLVDDIAQMRHLQEYGYFRSVGDEVGDLGECIASDTGNGHATPGVTVCMNMGIAAEDLPIVRFLFEKAQTAQVGTTWSVS